MYTSTAAQHLLSQTPSVRRLSPSVTLFAAKSSPFLTNLKAHDPHAQATNSSSLTPLFARPPRQEASNPRGARVKTFLPPLRALGYQDGGGDEDDDVYVKSFKPNQGSRDFSAGRENPNQGRRRDSAPQERFSSSRMGERRGSSEGGERPRDSNPRFSSERGGERAGGSSQQRASTSAPGGGRPGFKPGFKGREPNSSSGPYSQGPAGRGGPRERAGSRGAFVRNDDAAGERDNASFRPRERGEFGGGDRNGARTKSQVRGSETRGRTGVGGDRRRDGGVQERGDKVDADSGEVVDGEYRHPDWKEDPKAARKAKKEPAVAPQVQFPNPMNKQPHVAILGGGMSGLVCALTLEELGIRSTVFDTGKHGLGGRMATRDIEIREGLSLAFDHAAQYFTVSDPKFRKLVDRWLTEGAVKEWKGVVGTFQAGGQFAKLADDVPRYVGTYGMRPLADHMVSQGRLIDVKRPVWISNMDAKGDRWSLNENGKPHGEYDAVVVAHNGKCANRLLAPSGAPQVFKQMKRLELSSIWALMAAFEEALPIPEGIEGGHLDGAFVEGVNAVSWMANNSGKLTLADKHAPHCWTFFSTAAFGKKNKVPQESIPVVKAEKVRREMLRGVEATLGLPEGSMPTPFFTKVQLWGAGLPTNTPGVPCIFDPIARVGICGDWLLGSSLEAAALSGMALAEHIADFGDRGELNPEEFSIGLQKGFSQVEGKDIGQFPGTPEAKSNTNLELVGSAL